MYIGRMVSPLDHQRWSYETQLRAGIETVGPFTQETESPWPLHFKHSHSWEKAKLVQVRFTIRLRDQRRMWMQDGCKVYMDSYMASNGSCFMVTWTIFKNHWPHGGQAGLPQNQEIMALGMLTTVGFILIYHVWRPARIEIYWNSIGLRTSSHVTSYYTWGCVITLHDFEDVLGRSFFCFLLGSHNFMVTALGSCVKCP